MFCSFKVLPTAVERLRLTCWPAGRLTGWSGLAMACRCFSASSNVGLWGCRDGKEKKGDTVVEVGFVITGAQV